MTDKIKIYINTLPVHNGTGGMKTFLLELLHALAKRQDKYFQYHLICSPSNKNIFDEIVQDKLFDRIVVQVNSLNPLTRILFEQFKLNKLLKATPNSILLNICNVAVMNCSVPQVTILQAPLSIAALRKTLPQKYIVLSKLHKIYYNLFVMRSIKISDKTIAVSEFMRQFLGSMQHKVEVIHEGVNLEQFKNINEATVLENTEPYILSISTLFPYKNMDMLLQAYSILKQKGFKQKLVIGGRDPDGKQLDILRSIAKELNIEADVNFLGLVPYNKVPALYKNAELFLFLSSVETFGLPVLEAMVSGVPVIASDKMSIPEVVNDAGILVNPDNTKEIADKMEYVLSSQEIKNKMIAKGKENVLLFNWDTTAEKFEKIFHDTVAKNFSAKL